VAHVSVQGTLEPVEKAMRDAKMDKSSINDIVLVGGSTRYCHFYNKGTSVTSADFRLLLRIVVLTARDVNQCL
jgi:hypothetical protein